MELRLVSRVHCRLDRIDPWQRKKNVNLYQMDCSIASVSFGEVCEKIVSLENKKFSYLDGIGTKALKSLIKNGLFVILLFK